MTTESCISIVEVDDQQATIDGPQLRVHNHRIHRDRAVLEMPDGKRITVIVDELRRALTNAQHAHR